MRLVKNNRARFAGVACLLRTHVGPVNASGCLSDLEKHCEKCDFATVKCPFAAHGCDHVVFRKTLTDHIQNNVTSHLVLLCTSMSKLQVCHCDDPKPMLGSSSLTLTRQSTKGSITASLSSR